MTSTKKSALPRTRFLWDANLSPQIPKALKILGFNTSHVGARDGAPPSNSSDEDIVAYSIKTNQIVVTSNHDMMMICAEQEQRFVWLDPNSKQLRRERQVIVVFTQISEWERILQASKSICVRALRTKCVAIEPDDAVRLAVRRMRDLSRKRSPRQRPGSSGTPIPGL